MTIQEFSEHATEHLPQGLGLNTFLLPDGVVFRQREAEKQVAPYQAMAMPLQAGWFSLHQDERQVPMIAVWQPSFLPWSHISDREDDFIRVEKALQALGWRVGLTRLNGSEIQLFLVNGNWQGNSLKDIGLEVDPDLSPGKQMKRLGILSVGRGCHYEPGYWQVKGGSIEAVTEYDRPEADGGLQISRSMARRLVQACGMEWHKDISRLQVWIASHDGLVKGMAVVRPTRSMDSDLVLPIESFDRSFRVKHGTLVKLVPHKVVRRPLHLKPMDGLLRMPEVLQAIRQSEVLQEQGWSMDRRNEELVKLAWESQYLEEYPEADDLANEPAWYSPSSLIRTLRRREYQENTRALADAAGGSLFVAPLVMAEATGQLLRSVEAKARQWNGLPGAYVSCLRGYWTDPRYAGVDVPMPGYVRLLWNDGDFDGFAMNPADVLAEDTKVRTDGGDGDDLLDGILMRNPWTMEIWVRLYRNPCGKGAGVLLKVSEVDVEAAVNYGVRIYEMSPPYRYQDPDLPLKLRQGVGLKVGPAPRS